MKLFKLNFREFLIVVSKARRSILMLGGLCFMTIVINSIQMAEASEGVSGAAGTVHVVSIEGFEFVPANIEVKVGDTIRWVNVDSVPHSATAEDKRWDSGLLINTAKWEMTVTKDSAGNYICTFHPVMKGSISLVD